MPFSPIIWPPNPTVGQSFTSDYGRTWWWDGCGWVASCCPPDTCTYSDGVSIWFQIEGGYIAEFLAFDSMDGNGNPVFVYENVGNLGQPGTYTLFFDIGTGTWIFTITMVGQDPLIVAVGPNLYGSYTGDEFVNIVTYCGDNTYGSICASYISETFVDNQSYSMTLVYANLLDTYPIAGLASAALPSQAAMSFTFNTITTDWEGTAYAYDGGVLCTDIDLGSSDPAVVPTGSWPCGDGTFAITSGDCICDPDINSISLVVSTPSGVWSSNYYYMPGIITGSNTFTIPNSTGGVYTLSFDGTDWSLMDGMDVISTKVGPSPVGTYTTNEFYDYVEVVCGQPYPALCYSVTTIDPPAVVVYTLFATVTTLGGVPISYKEDGLAGQSITWNSGISKWEDDVTAALTLSLTDSYNITSNTYSWTSTDVNLTGNTVPTLNGCGA